MKVFICRSHATRTPFENPRILIALNWAEMDMFRFENNRILPHVSNVRVEIFKNCHEFGTYPAAQGVWVAESR